MTEQTSPYDTLMIGALLTIPVQVIGRRVAAAVVAQGFTDYRSTYQPVFQWCQPEGSRLTELAKRAEITKQSMSEIIDSLVQSGYVERIPDPTDGRAVLIRRTARGWEINRIARQVIEQIQQEWTQALGQERFTSLLESLRHLAILIDEPLGAAGLSEASMLLRKRRSSQQKPRE